MVASGAPSTGAGSDDDAQLWSKLARSLRHSN
jgi:hypothetical protein